ncbi:uncharacterized protein LOC125493291 [Beta vulgaris subsp. vulgaris]|uniref:uncharacterized protein LOC125493291 n=1 Tax=Beta vulgaris subsp. vulgaris TaxID=3555 RepID=UPI002548CF10|nr:uncharacterized protein LOC125493291 [Beta vulgaris subsp. vulgaris]
MGSEIVKICDLSKASKRCSIKVRVIRVWEKPAFNKNDVVEKIDAILMDKEGYKIQLTCKKSLLSTFSSRLKEGKYLEVSNFSVRDNDGVDRGTRHTYRIDLNYSSHIAECEDLQIDSYGLEFVTFDDILSEKYSNVFLIDFIGEVSGYSSIQEKPSSKLMTIDLIDLENKSLTCVLWGKYADEFTTYLKTRKDDESIIVVGQQGNSITYQGEIRIATSRHATRLFINSEIPAIMEFNNKKNAIGARTISPRPSEISTETNEFLKEDIVKDISDLMQCEQSGLGVCLATIEDIDTNFSWYYESCKICYKGVKRDGDKITCKRCEKVLKATVPRFRLKIIVSDKTDDATFVLFEKEVHKLLDKSASDLLEMQVKKGDKDGFPEEFTKLLGKRLLFKVEIPHPNKVGQSKDFAVINTTDDQTTIDKWMGLYMKMVYEEAKEALKENESVKEIEVDKDHNMSNQQESATSVTPQKRILETNGDSDSCKYSSPLDARYQQTRGP